MSYSSETGNAKNVANFQKLLEQVSAFKDYNPSVENLKTSQLKTLYSAALTAVKTVERKRTANKNAIHARQQEYLNLKPLATRIINQLDILNLAKGVLDQAKSLNKAIQGSSKKKNTSNAENEKEHHTISTSHQSYTNMADNFLKLINLLTTIAAYKPNTEELKLTSLNTYYEALVNSTKLVDQTEAKLNTSLIERDHILYANGTGLYTIAQNVKKYIKSLFGATSPEYTKVSKIKFTTH